MIVVLRVVGRQQRAAESGMALTDLQVSRCYAHPGFMATRIADWFSSALLT